MLSVPPNFVNCQERTDADKIYTNQFCPISLFFVLFLVVCLKRCLVSPLITWGRSTIWIRLANTFHLDRTTTKYLILEVPGVWKWIISQEGKTLRERARAKKKQYHRRGSLFRGAVCIHQCHSDGGSFRLPLGYVTITCLQPWNPAWSLKMHLCE